MKKLTVEYVKANITDVSYHRFSQAPTVTICLLVLRNGYTVVGKSACVDPEHFDEKTGKKLAYEHAMSELWPVLGFRLADQVHGTGMVPENRKSEDFTDWLNSRGTRETMVEVREVVEEIVEDKKPPTKKKTRKKSSPLKKSKKVPRDG